MKLYSLSGLVCIAMLAGASIATASVSSLHIHVTSSWDSGHNGEITFTNDGSEAIEGWQFSFANGPAITSAWNCEWTTEGDTAIFDDAGWNASVATGATITIGYGASGSLEQTITAAEFNGIPVEVVYDGGGGDGDDGNNDDDGGGDSGDGGGGSTCLGDADGSGEVDVNDVIALIGDWGDCVDCSTDLDENGIVDIADLLLMIAAWGDCPSVEPDGKRIVAYYIEWGIYGRDYQPADMPLDKITHVNYAFANIGSDLKIAIGDPYAAIEKSYPGDTWDQPYRGTYNQLNNVLRAKYPHIKTLISVGGWTWSARFSDVALTAASRSTFATSCVEFIQTYNFDGVDIDWEYPVCCGLGGNTYRPEDTHNYTLLMAELRAQLDVAAAQDGRDYLLTIASAGGVDKLENYELAPLAATLDWVNTMSYDFMGAWDLSLTGHHSGLYANPENPSPNENVRLFYNSHESVQPWLDAGVPADKIVLGVPFYGRAWGGVTNANNGLFQSATTVPPGTWDDWSSGATGVNDYTQIAALLQAGGYERHWDEAALVPWLWSPTEQGGHFISYEDPESIQIKMDYINANGLGGAMFWEVTADREAALLDVIHGALSR